jgi:hypothetical protein
MTCRFRQAEEELVSSGWMDGLMAAAVDRDRRRLVRAAHLAVMTARGAVGWGEQRLRLRFGYDIFSDADQY